VIVETFGDGDIDNDIFLGEDLEPSVAGPHPIFDGVVDFCDALDVIR
jgi:hypothetical protein